MGDLSLPITVEQDGWKIESSSEAGGRQSADQIRATVSSPSDAPTSPLESPQPQSKPSDDTLDAPVAGDEPTDAPAVDASTAPEPDAAEPAPAPKKPKTAAERKADLRAEINALTREKHAERAELDRLRRERDGLAARPADPRESRPEPKPATPQPAAKADPPKPIWAEFEAAGKSWDEYQDAKDTWTDARIDRVREEAKADARAEAQARIEAERATFREREDKRAYDEKMHRARTQHPEFDTIVARNLKGVPQTPFLADVVKLHPNGGEVYFRLAEQPDVTAVLSDLTVNATNAMMEAVLGMDDPMPLFVHLAENPEEFSRLAGLHPRTALVALGSLIARLDGANTGSPSSAPPVTSAAAPIRPVAGTRGTGAVAKSPDDMDFSPEFIDAENRRDRERERRRHL